MSMQVINAHYFVYGLRLIFSCNLRILFIRQCSEGRSVAQPVVLLCSDKSEYHVAVTVATAVEVLSIGSR
jgi:hypothetical protein